MLASSIRDCGAREASCVPGGGRMVGEGRKGCEISNGIVSLRATTTRAPIFVIFQSFGAKE